MLRILTAALLLVAGCRGESAPAEADDAPEVGLRRLSIVEFENTVHDLLGVDIDADGRVPSDPRDPFDNDYLLQQPSGVLVEGYEALATQAAVQVLEDESARSALVGCDPAASECLPAFVERFGQLALRRPLDDYEIDGLVAMGRDFAGQTGDAWTGPEMALRALLQHPHFLYRVEIGEGAPGSDAKHLTDYEIATRMSYLLWGTTPDADLLAKAAAGDLRDDGKRREIAREMSGDARARDQLIRFHALWLGYGALNQGSALTGILRSESDALVQDVLFDEPRSYMELFQSQRTWVTPELAAHYGWSDPGSARWIDVPEEERAGILGHGAFLAVASKFGDTSPTQRRKLIRERLMCETVLPPPPDVNVDEPPRDDQGGSECKADRYAAHRDVQGCRSCHESLDPVGNGLERWDQEGVFRTHDTGHPECGIEGDGEIVGIGAFRGPGGLADMLVEQQIVDACSVEQLFRYAHGRPARIPDEALLAELVETFRGSGHRFDELVVELVSHPSFAWRKPDDTQED